MRYPTLAELAAITPPPEPRRGQRPRYDDQRHIKDRKRKRRAYWQPKRQAEELARRIAQCRANARKGGIAMTSRATTEQLQQMAIMGNEVRWGACRRQDGGLGGVRLPVVAAEGDRGLKRLEYVLRIK